MLYDIRLLRNKKHSHAALHRPASQLMKYVMNNREST